MELHVLDVGHGSCCVVKGEAGAVSEHMVVDVGSWEVLRAWCYASDVDYIDTLVLTHFDADHARGVVGLLGNGKIGVGSIFVNADFFATAAEEGDTSEEILTSRRLRDRLLRLIVGTDSWDVRSLERGTEFSFGAYGRVVCLWPPHRLLMLFPKQARALLKFETSRNRLSICCTVEEAGQGLAAFMGDIDGVAWAQLERYGTPDLACHCLVYPHHGSATNGGAGFAERLLATFEPSLVVFQNGRGRWDLPDKEVVEAVRRGGAAVMCSQLNEQCCRLDDAEGPKCAGTITVDSGLRGAKHLPTQVRSERPDHAGFVTGMPAALCRLVPPTS